MRQYIIGDIKQKYLLRTNRRRTVKLHFVHREPHTGSNISICIVAGKQAKVKLQATTTIRSSAVDSHAWLEIIVITSDRATVQTAPNLEIDNNQCQAGHALTTKHIGKNELFYLMSRGLTKDQAWQLIVSEVTARYHNGVRL